MPGGVDMHCHIVGPKVNMGRKLSPEHKRSGQPVRRTRLTRSGTMGSVPSTFATGYKYAGLGYTTAFDAAIPPLFARHAHQEFDDTPCIDKGFFALMGNNHYVMRSIQRGELEKLRAFVGWLLGSAKGYAAKLVNPGGVENWKNRQAGNVKDLDTLVDHFGVTPRQIIRSMAQAVDELRLPHAVHIHTNNLGLPGNWTTTLETMKLLEGHRGHLTHIQFHSYGGGDAGRGHLRLEGRSAGRVRQRASQPHGGRRPGRLRPDHEHDRRRAGRLLPEQALQDQVVQRRHRAGRRAAASCRSSTRTRA